MYSDCLFLALFTHKTERQKCKWNTGAQDKEAARAALITALNTNQTFVSQAITEQKYLVNYNQSIVKNLLKSTLKPMADGPSFSYEKPSFSYEKLVRET